MDEHGRIQIIQILQLVEGSKKNGAEVSTPNAHDILSGTILLEGTILKRPRTNEDYPTLLDKALKTHPSLEQWLTSFLNKGEQGFSTLKRLLQVICAIKSLE